MSPSNFVKSPISYVEIRVFSHATEDAAKVELAVRNILPEELGPELVFNKTPLVGHHANPIILLQAKLVDQSKLPMILEKFGQETNSLDKEQFGIEIKQHVEKHNLYLRLDKQSAFLGKIKFSSNDPIRLKVHFKNKSPEQIIEICKQAGLLL